jgi:LysM repeat protein
MQHSFLKNYPGYLQYVVQPNDSLYMIAKNYNTTVENLKQINNLVSNTIYPNQILYVPMNTTSHGMNTYITKDGESLNEILKKFNLSVNDFAYNNDLGKLKLEENQLISTDKRTSDTHYLVMPNDKIEDILAKFNLSPLEFLKLNEKNILQNGKGIIIK